MRERVVDVDGMPIFVREAGSGEPVLCVHGNPTSSWLWRGVMPYLAEVARPVAPDLYGFGRSAKPAPSTGVYTTGAYASFLGRLCDALELDRVHLVVHDFGGPIGLGFALANTGRVRSLAVLNTIFYPDYEWHAWAVQMRTPGTGEELMATMSAEGVRAFNRMLRRRAVSDEDLEPYVAAMLDPGWQAACLALYRSVPDRLDFDASALLGGLRHLPACVVWSAEDPAIPASFGPRFAADLDAEYHEVPDAGHFLQEDAPEVVGPILRDHVARSMRR